jgi:hypothetical protein
VSFAAAAHASGQLLFEYKNISNKKSFEWPGKAHQKKSGGYYNILEEAAINKWARIDFSFSL